MKIETHQKALEEHKEVIFKWALDVKGIENSQRIIGLHASRAATELLSIFLNKNKLVSHGFQVNHRWFKSKKVVEKLPEFSNKDIIINKMVELENLCESLTYGAPKPVNKTEEAITLLKEIEKHLEDKR